MNTQFLERLQKAGFKSKAKVTGWESLQGKHPVADFTNGKKRISFEKIPTGGPVNNVTTLFDGDNVIATSTNGELPSNQLLDEFFGPVKAEEAKATAKGTKATAAAAGEVETLKVTTEEGGIIEETATAASKGGKKKGGTRKAGGKKS